MTTTMLDYRIVWPVAILATAALSTLFAVFFVSRISPAIEVTGEIPWEAMLGSGGVLAVALKFGHDGLKAWRAHRSGRTFKSAWETYKAMHLLMEQTGAHRCLILKAHNGGGDLTVKSPTYSSVLYEVTDTVLPEISETWQQRRLDEQYYGLLRQVFTEDVVTQRTTSMQPGQLRSSFNLDGVEFAIFANLLIEDAAFFFLALNFTHAPAQIDLARTRVRGALFHLRSLIRQ